MIFDTPRVIIIFIFITQKLSSAALFFIINDLKTCPEYPDVPIKSQFNVKEVNSTLQAIYGYFHLPFELGDELRCTMKISTKIGSQWVQIIKISEKNPCKTAKKYLGESWVELQRRLGVAPGICPVAKGRYAFDNYYIDLNKVTIRLPNGEVKGTTTITDMKTKDMMWCLQYHITIKNL